jgi:hypothetical protein
MISVLQSRIREIFPEDVLMARRHERGSIGASGPMGFMHGKVLDSWYFPQPQGHYHLCDVPELQISS